MLRSQARVRDRYYNLHEMQALPGFQWGFCLTCREVGDIIEVGLFESYFAGGR
jgi:hypothetical protein